MIFLVETRQEIVGLDEGGKSGWEERKKLSSLKDGESSTTGNAQRRFFFF